VGVHVLNLLRQNVPPRSVGGLEETRTERCEKGTEETEAIERQRGPRSVSEEAFAPGVVARGDVHPRVKVEALVFGGEA
jgi:hypothetical protein